MSGPDRDAAKAARKAAREREKRGKQIAKIRAARDKEKKSGTGAQLDVIHAHDDGSEGRGLYWVMRNVLLGPPVLKIFNPVVEGAQNVPDFGRGHPRGQPPVVHRLAVHAAGAGPAGHLRG